LIKTLNLVSKKQSKLINDFASHWNKDFNGLQNFLSSFFNIYCSVDADIVRPYMEDWSNIDGFADILVKPESPIQCAIILKTAFFCKIPITVSAGQTNLTGSATPKLGIVLSTSLLTSPNIKIDKNKKEVIAPVGLRLEDLRKEVLKQSNMQLFYPVDPTSRYDAYIGGTISCNASGFIPGERGATRYWVDGFDLILPNGNLIHVKRGQYISKNNRFILFDENNNITIPIPKYKRPNIKNASGPFSCDKGEIDFVDLIIGSEGIYGMLTSCTLKLMERPKEYLDLFISLKNELSAVKFHDFLYDYFNGDMSQLSALEYFGYNCQSYMNHKDFLFNNKSDVGIYIQIPIYNNTLEKKIIEWIDLFKQFDNSINLEDIIVLNDPLNWQKFFEARHSIPDNALRKTRQLDGVSIITDTIVPPENFMQYLKSAHKVLQKSKIEYLLFGHLGDCHLHFHLIPNGKQDKRCMEVYDYLVDTSSKLGGVYSAEHGTGKRKRNDFKKCYGNSAVKMVKKSKLAIDPDLILNRGNIFID